MVVTIELEDGEVLPANFSHFLIGSAPYYEKRYGEAVPKIHLQLLKDDKLYRLEAGFWLEQES